MQDNIVRAVAGNGAIRAFFASTKNTVETARKIHGATPVVTAALGRLLTGALIMGQMLKNDGELITLQVKGNGSAGGMLATASNNGTVKGYAANPTADAPLKPNGKLDVSEVIGDGMLTVVRDTGLKKPYVGQTPLVTGEIAEDIANYFANSEQVPSVVALGVLIDTDYTVKQAGGFIIQLLPFASDDITSRLEAIVGGLSSVTGMFEKGFGVKDMLNEILGSFGVEIVMETPAKYFCNCSRERVEKALISIGKADIEKILEEDKKAEVNCHFCENSYVFNETDLVEILKKA